MKRTDTSESGLESLIVRHLVEGDEQPHDRQPENTQAFPGIHQQRESYAASPRYVQGESKDYDRDHALDLEKLFVFLRTTQAETYRQLNLDGNDTARQRFLHRIQSEVAKRGVIDVLRKGIKHGPANVDLFYGTPTPGNLQAAERFSRNQFSVTRQLHYSKDETKLALDLAIFINGLPFATFELKNNLTKQTYNDAINQYKNDRDPRELLFQFGRCAVHFALDDQQVWMCTDLKGKASWFLPFNKGFLDGAGNPSNPDGIMTDYLWRQILERNNLARIIENYAQVIEERDEKTGRKRRKQIFPRYHQLDVVQRLLNQAEQDGPGHRYLIQHSAGSGKSNSITWLAHQLIELKKDGQPIFDSVIVITDRKVLDKQIRDNIRHFAQVSAVVGAVTQGSGQLRAFIRQGKRIIISTVQKFPFIVDELGNEHRDRTFAILIDEAHSSQGGRAAAALNLALSEISEAEEETTEDKINRVMESRKMLPNASYFAFTATPKNKTLQLFGLPYHDGGAVKHRPFHTYTMKQAIQEGFILDVLKYYTSVESYYRLTQTIPDDPEFDAKKALRKLKRYVESHEHAIHQKAEIMIDHFHDSVIARRKIGGQARAMVVTGSIRRAVQYYRAFQAYLKERKSHHQAIVAFSGEHDFGGEKVTEASLNGFPSAKIPEKIQEDPYRFLIVADKFQTGYDEPLLHTMYVDKALSGIKAVQTLTRLNRAHPKKHDTFVLDFSNDVDTIQESFQDFYRTTILGDETDPNKLHDLQADLEGYQIYTEFDVDLLVERYLNGAERDELDPILDACVSLYKTELDEDQQVDFKSKAKAFGRAYSFLASILDYSSMEWEKLSIFLNFLTPKLPAPKEEDLSKGILEAIDMDSYRAEVQAQISIALADEDSEIEPVPTAGGAYRPEPVLDHLSNIIRAFNEQFGNFDFKDEDNIYHVIAEDLPRMVSEDQAYQNARQNADKDTARIEHDRALREVLLKLLMEQTDTFTDLTELFKQYSDNPIFQKWLSDLSFSTTYEERKRAA